MKAVRVIGIVLTGIGAFLLYTYKDPKFGDGLMRESYKPRANAIGARLGMGCVIAGIVLGLISL